MHPSHVPLADPSCLTRSGAAFLCLLRSLHVYIICSTSAYDIGIAAARRLGQGSCMSANDPSTWTSSFRRVLLFASKVRADVTQRPRSQCSERSTIRRKLLPRRLMFDWYNMTKVTSQPSGSPWECGILSFRAQHCVRHRGTKTTMQQMGSGILPTSGHTKTAVCVTIIHKSTTVDVPTIERHPLHGINFGW